MITSGCLRGSRAAGLFWGMYLQPSPSVMVASIGAGLAALLAAYAWTNGALRLPRQRPG